jgi:hypothetical protein
MLNRAFANNTELWRDLILHRLSICKSILAGAHPVEASRAAYHQPRRIEVNQLTRNSNIGSGFILGWGGVGPQKLALCASTDGDTTIITHFLIWGNHDMVTPEYTHSSNLAIGFGGGSTMCCAILWV